MVPAMIKATKSDLEEPSELEEENGGFFRTMTMAPARVGTSAKQGVSRMADAIDQQATSLGSTFRNLWRSEPKPVAEEVGAPSEVDGEAEPQGVLSPPVSSTRVQEELFSMLWARQRSPSRCSSISSEAAEDDAPPPPKLSQATAGSTVYDSDGEVPGEDTPVRQLRKQKSLNMRAREKLQNMSRVALPVDLCCVHRSKVRLAPMEGLPDSPSTPPSRKSKDVTESRQFQI